MSDSVFHPWLNRGAILLAVAAAASIVIGASLSFESWPLPGTDVQAFHLPPITAELRSLHVMAGAIAAGLAVILAILAVARKAPAPARNLSAAILGVGLVLALLGMPSVIEAARTASTLLHTLLAHLFFAGAVGLAVITRRGWGSPPSFVEDTWHPPLRTVAKIVVGMIFLQIFLGACYRRDLIGVLPHILNAMLVLLLNLVVGGSIMRQFPKHKCLRPAGHGLLLITCVQVLLGFATFIILLQVSATTRALVIVGAVHALTASLTLGMSIILFAHVSRNVRVSDVGTVAAQPTV